MKLIVLKNIQNVEFFLKKIYERVEFLKKYEIVELKN